MNKIVIDYDSKRGRFVISCPFVYNDLIRGLPNRRFESKQKVWTAPAIRANVVKINELVDNPVVMISSSTKDVINEMIAGYDEKRKRANSSVAAFPAWYAFKTKPRMKQMEALNKIFGLKAYALFMGMRTGKTKVVIDRLCASRMQGTVDTFIIVCPLSVRRGWVDQFNLHAPFPVSLHLLDTSKPKLFDKWLAEKHDFRGMIVGVESLSAGSAFNYCERLLCSSLKTEVVVDESQNIKNHDKTRTQRCISLARMAENRGIMTGTPIAIGIMDLFAQFEFIDPDIIGTGDYYTFRNRYAEMGGFENKKIIGYKNVDELMELIEPYIFQVDQSEVFPDAPPKQYMVREVELTPQQKEIYKALSKQKFHSSEKGSIEIQNVLEKMLRLQEVTSGYVSYAVPEEQRVKNGPKFIRHRIDGHNPKIRELLAVLEENPGPTIIWCAFTEEIEDVAAALREVYGEDKVVELHGGIEEEQRHINVNVRFNGGSADYLVANTATGGAGLTINRAITEVYMSNTRKYIDRAQSEERAFDEHKPQGTLIVDIIAPGTVDDDIIESMREKKDVDTYVREKINQLKLKY